MACAPGGRGTPSHGEVTTGVAGAPLISTIIPCHNGERYLAEAIESVLGQTYRTVEVIVIDDGSTDRSSEVAQSFRGVIRCHRQAHSGSAAARNLGLDLARGAFLAFLDADDLWPEDKLQRQLAAFESDPSLEIVAGHAEQFVSPELSDSAKAKVRVDPRPIPAQLPGALLVRREVFHRVGTYSREFVTAGEMDWFMRATELGVRIRMLPDVVLRRRIHASNHGILRRDARRDYVRVLKAALDRRRTEPGALGRDGV
jgi:glycosyltransferase involved in cell wall biosynthesis